MRFEQLLTELQRREIDLRVEGDRIKASAAPGQLTAELAEQIRAYKPELLKLLRPKATSVAPVQTNAGRDRYPLSSTQSRQAGASRASVALPLVLRLTGALHVPALKAAIEHIVERHAPLRSRFFLSAERPYQEVLDRAQVVLTSVDMTAHAGAEEKALRFLAGEMAPPLDLSLAPVGRFHLIRTGSTQHVFSAAFSPLVIDGWSQDVFVQELQAAYDALSQGSAPRLARIASSYADLIAWQDERIAERRQILEQFWEQRLGARLPALPLPTDHPRPRRGTTAGEVLPLKFSTAVADRIREVARATASTPQIVLLAAYYVWLFRLSGRTDIVVATPAAARLHPNTEGLIGAFVNMLLLRMNFDPSVSFSELVETVRDHSFDAYEHQELPMDQLKVRSQHSSDSVFAPAFQVEFGFQQVSQRPLSMGGVSIEPLELPAGDVSSELALLVKDLGRDFTGSVEFKSELFERQTIQHWVRCFQELLEHLVNEPAIKIAMAPLTRAESATIRTRMRALVESGERVPRWLEREQGIQRWSEVASVSIVEPNGQSVPLGCYGQLRLQLPFRNTAADSRVRLSHNGELHPEVNVRADESAASFEQPQTDTEIQIATLFQDLLGRRIGATDDYFEHGGNSLLAVKLFKEIHHRFGVNLPFTTILDAPTPRLLADQVRAGGPLRHGSLVTLKQGTRREKLFLVHDGDGETLLYRNLALRMPAEISVVGLLPRSEGPLLIDTTIQGIASHYVREIRVLQPEGPYLVGGLCAGGLIAFEVCRQLDAVGAEVALLVLLDAAPPFARARNSSIDRWQRFSSLGKGLQANPRAITHVAREASRKIVGFMQHATQRSAQRASTQLRVEMLRRWRSTRMPWPSWLEPPTFRELFERMEGEYEGRLAQIPSLLVRASSGLAGDKATQLLLLDPQFEWPTLISGEIKIADVPGGHSTMLREPHVEATADVVRTALREVLRSPH